MLLARVHKWYPYALLVVGSDGVVDVLNLNFSELVDFDRVNHIFWGALCQSRDPDSTMK